MTRGNSQEDNCESKRPSRVNRRRFLATSAVSVAGLAGCLGGGGGDSSPTDTPEPKGGTATGTPKDEKPFEGETLKAAVWSGGEYWMGGFNDEIVPRFEEKTGATVELSTVWAEIVPKIKAAPEDNPPWDVTVGDAYVGYYGEQADLWKKVRYENISNFGDVYQYLKDFRSHEYGVPVSGMPMAILYRSDSDFKPSSWAEFATQEGREAKTAQEGSWYAYPGHIAAYAMDDLPQSDEMYDEQYHEAVFDTLNDFNVELWYEGGAEFREALRNGVIEASTYYMNTHRDAQDSDVMGFDYPDEGSIWYWDHYRVVRGTDKRLLAEKWIDHLLDPEIQTLSAELQYNAAANKKADLSLPILKENYPQSNSEWDDKAVFFQIPYLPNHWKKFNGFFKEVKTGSWGN